jgi:hypothetical protein
MNDRQHGLIVLTDVKPHSNNQVDSDFCPIIDSADSFDFLHQPVSIIVSFISYRYHLISSVAYCRDVNETLHTKTETRPRRSKTRLETETIETETTSLDRGLYPYKLV